MLLLTEDFCIFALRKNRIKRYKDETEMFQIIINTQSNDYFKHQRFHVTNKKININT